MSKVVGQILNDFKREKIINTYQFKHRFIEHHLYQELKHRPKCMKCGKKFSGRIPEIHHKVALSKGGTNDRSNLMAVCHGCHLKLDYESGVGEQFFLDQKCAEHQRVIFMELSKIEQTLEELKFALEPLLANMDKKQRGQAIQVQHGINTTNKAIRKLKKLMVMKGGPDGS